MERKELTLKMIPKPHETKKALNSQQNWKIAEDGGKKIAIYWKEDQGQLCQWELPYTLARE